MRNTIVRNAGLLLIACFSMINDSFAQEDFDKLLEAGLEDANTLIEGYVSPALEGFGSGLGNGWYTTAATHKTLGFEILVTANAAYVPDEDLFYTPLLQNGTVVPSDGRAPTIFGPDTDLPSYEYNYTEEITGQTFTGTFTAPEGLNLEDEIGSSFVPVPMLQIGAGIVKNTDLKIRWTPEIDIGDDGTFKLIGFGIMHDIKQHIPGIKMLPFDLSAFLGYTSISSEVTFETDGTESGVNTNNGQGEFDVNTLTVQALISKKFSVITFYGGLGFNRVRSELNLKGDYEVSDEAGNSVIYSNPIGIDFQSGGARLTAGMRLKLAIVTLNVDYTLQKYNTLTVGFGFSFREN